MSLSVNHVIIGGNATRDPESKQVGQTTITKFSVAVNRKFTVNGEKKEETGFFDVDCFGKLAEIVAKYVAKGSQVIVMGRLKQDTWEKDGQKRSKIGIVADSVQFVGARERSDAAEARNGGVVPQAASDNSGDEPPF